MKTTMSDETREDSLSTGEVPAGSSVVAPATADTVIEVDDVNFAYVKGKDVLRDISMQIN